MAVNYKNSIFQVYSNAHDTFPASTSEAGTVSTDNTTNGKWVVGVGTSFKTLELGGWIVDITHDEIRKITRISDDLNLTIDQPFSNSLSAIGLVYISPSIYTEISIVFSGTGKIDGNAVPANIGFSWGKTGRDMSSQRDFVDPIIVDSTGVIAYIEALE